MKLIDKQRDFEEICSALALEPIIAIDTEFERRATYFAKLSIIQIMTLDNQPIIIDALAGLNLNSFALLLRNESVLKILHSPEQDFEIFYHLFGNLPINIFDTQLAARICEGGSDMISYSNLCRELLGAEVDKTLQRAKWLKRPLSPNLLAYAVRDTEFLIPLYNILSDTLRRLDKVSHYQELLTRLLDVNNYKVSINKLIKKMSIRHQSLEVRDRLIALAAFREECARSLDIPRSHFATDNDLMKLCRALPTSEQELSRIPLERLKRLFNKRFRANLFEICQSFKDDLPI